MEAVGVINTFNYVNITFDFEELDVKIACSTIDGIMRCEYIYDIDIGMTFYSNSDNNLSLNLDRAIVNTEYEEEFIGWLQEIINDNIIEILVLLKNIHKNRIESNEAYDKFNEVFYKELMLI